MTNTEIAAPLITKFTSCARSGKGLKTKPSLPNLFNHIRKGTWKEQVSEIRRLKRIRIAAEQRLADATEDDYEEREIARDIAKADHDKAKATTVPAFVMSGVCAWRKKGSLEHNGLLCIDIDGKDNAGVTVEDMKATVNQMDFVAGWFVSPSGDGLKVIVKIEADETTHKQSFLAAQAIFQNEGLKVDPQCKDMRRLCIASYDPDAELRLWSDVSTLNKHWVIEGKEVIESKEVTEFTEFTDELSTSFFPSRASVIQEKEYAHARLDEREDEAKEKLKQDKKLSRLYYKHVAPYVEQRSAYASRRNEVLVDIVTFLYRAVGEKYVIPLAMAFYDLNLSKFSGATTRDEHQSEAQAHLDNTRERWADELTEMEFAIIGKFPTQHSVTAFRICRDLAMLDKPGTPPGQFYIGQTDLSYRLGASSGSVNIALNALQEHVVIKMIQKGPQYSKQVKMAKASIYKWLFPLPLNKK